MGRYAFFSTGIEYKFAFAIQDSSDIFEFGGYVSTRDPEEIVWIAEKDTEYVKKRLNDGSSPMLDLTKYEKTTDGYYAYMSDIREQLRTSMDIQDHYDTDQEHIDAVEPYYLLVLGHSIYFQLHMVPILYASYET
jgi:hypothetical protein